MTHDEMIAVIQADKDGKPIQFKVIGSNSSWTNVSKRDATFNFNFQVCDWRIKPTPQMLYLIVRKQSPECKYIDALAWSYEEVQRRFASYSSETHKIITFKEVLE